MTLTCPDHGRVTPRLAWCRVEGEFHLGDRCPKCNLWLRWLPKKDGLGARLEALR